MSKAPAKPKAAVKAVPKKQLAKEPPPKRAGGHKCPSCGRHVMWDLALCTVCSWRNVPQRNYPYGELMEAPTGRTRPK